MSYTAEQQRQLDDLRTRLDTTGHPEKVMAINRQIEAGMSFDAIMEPVTTPAPSVRPTRPGATPIEAPPRTGPGSGAAIWRSWIVAMADIDEEGASRMSRADIILFAEEENIIDSQPV